TARHRLGGARNALALARADAVGPRPGRGAEALDGAAEAARHGLREAGRVALLARHARVLAGRAGVLGRDGRVLVRHEGVRLDRRAGVHLTAARVAASVAASRGVG